MIGCKNKCERFDIIPRRGWIKYPNGCYCSTCCIAFLFDGILCGCCKHKVRKRTRQHRNPIKRHDQYMMYVYGVKK